MINLLRQKGLSEGMIAVKFWIDYFPSQKFILKLRNVILQGLDMMIKGITRTLIIIFIR